MTQRYTRLAPSSSPEVEVSNRLVRYIFSTEEVGRDRFIVKDDAWSLDNFRSNPVFMWQHSYDVPPIGKVVEIYNIERELRGSVRYAETEFADEIFQLVKGGILNAVSTSWVPLEPPVRSNQAGVDAVFTNVDLIEISQVCVPALPAALASARSRGYKLSALRGWSERRLDTGARGVARDEVERIYRAVSGSSFGGRPALVPQHEAAAERRERARAMVARLRADDAAWSEELRRRLLAQPD